MNLNQLEQIIDENHLGITADIYDAISETTNVDEAYLKVLKIIVSEILKK